MTNKDKSVYANGGKGKARFRVPTGERETTEMTDKMWEDKEISKILLSLCEIW